MASPLDRRAAVGLGGLLLGALAAGALAGRAADGAADPVLAAPAPIAAVEVPRFEDATRRAGIGLRHEAAGCSGNVAGAAWGDVDDDGDLDLYLPQYAGPSRLWLGDGHGRFRAGAERAGVADVPLATGASFADYDNDGDQDLHVVSHAQDRLFANDGQGRFSDETALSGLADPGPGSSSAWADFDGDGRLDLYVVNGDNCSDPRPAPDHLYRNRGEGRFEDVTEVLERGGATTAGVGMQAAWVDVDGDRDPDLYLANDHLGFEGNRLWRNDGPGPAGWRFTPVAADRGGGLEVSSMGIGVGDLDGDGGSDLVVSDTGPPRILLGRAGGFRRAVLPPAAGGERPPTWGVAVVDLDNDGDEDVFAAAGALGLGQDARRDLLYLNDGRGRFSEVASVAGVADPGRARAVAPADVNGDGLMDLLVARLGQSPRLLVNRGTGHGPQHGVRLRLHGRTGPADACGARVVVTASRRSTVNEVDYGSEGLGSSGERIAHAGIGVARRADAVAIGWPGGRLQRLAHVRADRLIEITEPARPR